MRLSTKGRYAVLAMMELALHENKGLLTLADLSLSQNISLSYLEQLFAKLRASNLVAGVRGPRGGYKLARPASDISVAEILLAVDEKADSENSEQAGHLNDMEGIIRVLWNNLSHRLHDFLGNISLADTITSPAQAAPNEAAPAQGQAASTSNKSAA